MTSLLTIATMSLNRYIYVCHNSHYKKIFSKRNSAIICMSVYCVGLILVLLNQAGIGDHSFDRKSLECIWDRMATYPYTVVYSVTLVWIPCVVIGICYLRLYFFVNMHKKKISNHKKKNGVNSPGAGIPSKPKLQLAKTFILIYAVFVTCWAPYALLIILDHKDAFLHEVHVYVTVWAHLHPSVNWLIYYFTQRKLADAYRQILGCGMYPNKRNQRAIPSPAETSDERPIERRPYNNHRVDALQQNNQQLSRDSPVMEWKPIATLSEGNLKQLSNNNVNIYHKLYEEMRAIHSDGDVQGYIKKGSFKGESYINMRASQSVGDLPEDFIGYERPCRKTSTYTESGLVQELCGIVRNLQSVMISHTFNTNTGITCEICDKSPAHNLNPVLQDGSANNVTEPNCTKEASEYPAPVSSDSNEDACVKCSGIMAIAGPMKEDSCLKTEITGEFTHCSNEKAANFVDGDKSDFILNDTANVPYENLFDLHLEQTESDLIQKGSAELCMSHESATDYNSENTKIQSQTIEKEANTCSGRKLHEENQITCIK